MTNNKNSEALLGRRRGTMWNEEHTTTNWLKTRNFSSTANTIQHYLEVEKKNLFQLLFFNKKTGNPMEIENINLNRYLGQPSPNELYKNLEKFENIKVRLKEIYDGCRVNAVYEDEMRSRPSRPFKIVAEFNSGDIEIFQYQGDARFYHINLLNEISKKFFYLLSCDIEITSEAFDYIRRVPENEWKCLVSKVNETPSLGIHALDVLNADQEAGFFSSPKKRSLSALRAFLEGEISRNEVAKIHLFDGLVHNHRQVAVEQLIDSKGNTNKKSLGVIKNVFHLINKKKMSSKEENNFLLSAKRLTPLHSQFFCVKGASHCHFFKKTKNSSIVIPPALFDCILKTNFEKKRIKSNPVLGHSLREDFADSSKRDLEIVSLLVKSPDVLHGRKVGYPIHAYLHDCDHMVLESSNFQREHWIRLAARLEKEGLISTSNIVLDRAVFSYLKTANTAKDNIDLQKHAGQELINQLFDDKETREDLFYSFQTIKSFFNS